jgi:nucleoside-diphosphate-sugar epimerase
MTREHDADATRVDPRADLPILDSVEDDLEDDVPRTVLITGAAGNIGRKLRDGWGDRYDLILIDQQPDPSDPELIGADLAELDEAWTDLFEEADTVVHLAATPDEFSAWEDLVRPNLDALANVLIASARAGVERVVFASSNHVMGGYRELGDQPITVNLPPWPGNPYGAAKLMGERLGRSLSELFEITFVALRLGWNQKGVNSPETLPDDWARALWLSNGDLVRLFTRAVEAELPSCEFVVVNGLSNNPGTRWSLAEAESALGFVPEDRSD